MISISLETTKPKSLINGTKPICGIRGSEIVIGPPSIYDNNSKRPTWIYLFSFVYAISAVEIVIIVFGLVVPF